MPLFADDEVIVNRNAERARHRDDRLRQSACEGVGSPDG
jgi:hypothetical protein